ncbi:septum formation family protein [Streptomyces sp. ALB3]|uniref:septum formation family protein n=1 Tax=Streptomyces sp. ALB3 TaxID=3374278 RepID=UPI003789D723
MCAVAASAAMLLTACTGGSSDDKPAHPVFGVPVEQQPRQALLTTQAARTASFTQTLTFTSASGDTVQTTSGRLDFPGGRAAGTIDWAQAEDLTEEARDTLLGVRLGASRAPARTEVAIEPDTIRLRAGGAGYWLRYEGSSDAFGTGAAIDALRGSEAAFGGTLLEVLSGAQKVKHAPAEKGGRTYRAELTVFNALRLFPKDLGSELTADIDPNGTATPVPLSISVDATGRVTRAEADLSGLLDKEDGALDEMTGLRAVLELGGFGAAAPVMPAASERTLDAKEAVRAVGEMEKGGCADLTTGTRTLDMMVSVPCAQPHDARIFAHARFDASYPGRKEAKRMAVEACTDGYRSAPAAWTGEGTEKGHFWYTWPGEEDWGVGADPVVTCYVETR